uniref:Potassium voltage-gated channel, Isk-related family, member 4 n=1 Tax=Scleropages formosus TaxID=113540 RepID=A0A8D0CLM2_SCLFO
ATDWHPVLGHSGSGSGSGSGSDSGSHAPERGGGHEYLYMVMVMSFYGVFLFALTLGYVRSKRREKRKSNVFTRLLREEEQREWGAARKKHSLSLPAAAGLCSVRVPPFHEGRVLAPLACALCVAEQSSVSSLSSTADVRFAIEEESDSGPEETPRAEGRSVTIYRE